MNKNFALRLSITKRPLLYMAGIFLAGASCWVWLSDEPLSLDAQRAMTALPGIPPEQNAYYPLWGLNASPELDAFEVGKTLVVAQAEAVKANAKAKIYDVQFSPVPYLGAKPMRIRQSPTRYCRELGVTPNCSAVLREHGDALKAELRMQAVFVQRYRDLRRYADFEDAMIVTPTAPLFPWVTVLYISELVDADIIFGMAQTPTRAAALTELYAEMLLWQKINRGAGNLITRMIGTFALATKYRLASEMLLEYPEIAIEHRDIMAKITQPLTNDDTQMGRVFMGEFRFGAAFIETVHLLPDIENNPASDERALPPWLHRLQLAAAFKTNATINANYARMRLAGDFYSQSAAAIAAGQSEFDKKTSDSMSNPAFWLYNPSGKMSLMVTSAAYSSYAYRTQNVAGYSRLVELQRQLALNRTPLAKVGEMIAATDKNLYDPYTQKAMAFNAVTQTISFATNNKDGLKQPLISVKIAAR